MTSLNSVEIRSDEQTYTLTIDAGSRVQVTSINWIFWV